MERWAENVSRHYGSQRAAEGEGVAQEELSDLDCLYRASLQAPSMHRGRGQATHPLGHKPGQNREEALTPLTQSMTLCVCLCVCVGVRRMLSGSARSKTATAEMERSAYKRQVELRQQVTLTPCLWCIMGNVGVRLDCREP